MRSLFIVIAGWLLITTGIHGADTPAQLIGADAIQPHLAIDKDGNVYAAFIQKGNIAVTVSTDRGKTFREPIIAMDARSRARGGMQRGPRIGVDTQKTITVTCPVCFDDEEYKKRYPTADLYFVTSKDGGKTWTAPTQVNEVTKKAPEALHWMAVAPSGEVHIAWLDMRSREGRGQDIYYSRLVNGKVSENIKVATTVCECCAPGLAVDAAGNPFIAYREGGDKESREIFAVHSADQGQSFTKPVQINHKPTRENKCPMSAPAVVVSPDGKKFAVAWKDVRADEPNVYWSVSDKPKFASEVLLHQETRGEQNHPSLAMDATGTIWAAWEDKQPGHRHIWVRTSARGDEGQAISDRTETLVNFPVVATNGTMVALVYEAMKDGKNIVLFRVLRADAQ